MKRLLAAQWNEQGAAATEFALLTLVLVPTALYAVFFAELGQAKLKAQEAGRYLVWEMTAVGLSDWQEGKHDDKFPAVRAALLNEVEQRWTDDMQSATPTVVNAKGPKPMSLTLSVDKAQTTLENIETDLWNVSVSSGVSTGPLGQGVDAVFRHFGFNTKGQVKGSVQIKVKNTLLHNTMPAFYTEKMLMKDEFVLNVKQALIVEQWDLKAGVEVVEVNQSGGCKTDYCKQVQRMSFLGLGQYMGFLSAGDFIFKVLNFHNPLNAVVASKQMKDPTTASSSHPLQVFNPDGHNTIRDHYTNVFKDTVKANESPYNKVYNKRGRFFLGCPREQQSEGTCKYN